MTSIASGSVAEIVELAMRLDTRRGRTLDDLHDLAYRLDRSDPAEVESQLLRRAMLATSDSESWTILNLLGYYGRGQNGLLPQTVESLLAICESDHSSALVKETATWSVVDMDLHWASPETIACVLRVIRCAEEQIERVPDWMKGRIDDQKRRIEWLQLSERWLSSGKIVVPDELLDELTDSSNPRAFSILEIGFCRGNSTLLRRVLAYLITGHIKQYRIESRYNTQLSPLNIDETFYIVGPGCGHGIARTVCRLKWLFGGEENTVRLLEAAAPKIEPL